MLSPNLRPHRRFFSRNVLARVVRKRKHDMSEQVETKLERVARIGHAQPPHRRMKPGALVEELVERIGDVGIATPGKAVAEQSLPDIHVALRSVPQRLVSVLGVKICDVTKTDAMRLMNGLIRAGAGRCHAVFIVNAHTLNVATELRDYRDVLNSADFVFNDGTGVRWAARQRGVELRANLVGTDLIPEFFDATAHSGYRYFLLGADSETMEKAAAVARDRFVGWTQAGYHHGFVENGRVDALIKRINASKCDMLLVGMGNPIQERWIHCHQSRLRVPLAIGVGGMFDHWIDKPRRAPLWVRKMGCEWVHKLILQPHKWRRYLLGNPEFLFRMTASKRCDLAAMQRDEGAAAQLAKNLQHFDPRSLTT